MTTNSVVKTFQIIEYLSTEGEGGVTEMAVALELDKTTIHRLLSTMKKIGYISQEGQSHRYSLSAKFFNLTKTRPEQRNLIQMLHPFLNELADLTEETASLALLSGTNVIYVDHIDSRHAIKVNVAVGHQYPAHTVGIGKSILACLKTEQVKDLYLDKEFEVLTANTINSLTDLLADLAKTRKRGYAVDNEECSEGLFCLAAPVLDASGEPVAGISTGFPLYRHPGLADRKKLAEMVCQVTAKASKALGYEQASKKVSETGAGKKKLSAGKSSGSK